MTRRHKSVSTVPIPMIKLAAGASLALTLSVSASVRAEPTPIGSGETPAPFGYNYGEVESTRSAAFGGAMRAAGNGTTAPFLNPANMALTRIYHIEAMAQITPEVGRQVYGGAIVDSTTSALAGGVAVSGGFLEPSWIDDGIDRSWMDLRIALAYPITQNFLVGLGGRYLKVTEEGNGPFTNSKASGGLVDDEGTGRFALSNLPTFDAGVTLRLADMVYVGLSGQNLTFAGTGLMPTTLGGGVAVGTQDFTIEADGVADFHSYAEASARVMAGGEYLLVDHVPLRLGYRFDQGANSHQLSGGVGYTSREFSIEASVRRTLVGPDATVIVFGIAYHLESSGLTKQPEEF
jgi:opacity protein-like surface antigen